MNLEKDDNTTKVKVILSWLIVVCIFSIVGWSIINLINETRKDRTRWTNSDKTLCHGNFKFAL
ncbi:MAG: hypothetical protein QXN55_00735 [Candidatus Nitrosotenuis sp.]